MKKSRTDSSGSDGKKPFVTLEEKRRKAAAVATSRILTDADFKKIDATQLRKQVSAHRKGGASAKATAKRKKREAEAAEEASTTPARQELVSLSSIEMVFKKRRHDKASRLETVMEGRKDRGKFGSKKAKADENSSTSHKVKAKKKNFMMVKHKLKFKAKRSFAEKARDLKKSLTRSRKFK